MQGKHFKCESFPTTSFVSHLKKVKLVYEIAKLYRQANIPRSFAGRKHGVLFPSRRTVNDAARAFHLWSYNSFNGFEHTRSGPKSYLEGVIIGSCVKLMRAFLVFGDGTLKRILKEYHQSY